MRNLIFAYDAKTKTQINCAVTVQLISLFVFATLMILQSLYFLNPEFQAYSHLLWLYSPVCVRNPEDRLSCDHAQLKKVNELSCKTFNRLAYLNFQKM